MILKKNIIREAFFNKYRNIIFKKEDYKKRYNFQQAAIKKRKKNNIFKSHKCLSCKFYNNISLWNNENTIRLYKKFNVHLRLKQAYSTKLISYSDKEACLQSYLIFLNKVYFSKKFNNVQKLNTILKINDLIILEFLEDYFNLELIYTNNFSLEKKIIKRLIS